MLEARALGYWPTWDPRFSGSALQPALRLETTRDAHWQGNIHIDVGGWPYEPWRHLFCPDGLPKRCEREFMRSQLSSNEINSPFYGTQSGTASSAGAKKRLNTSCFR
jgi:hypothetical protein